MLTQYTKILCTTVLCNSINKQLYKMINIIGCLSCQYAFFTTWKYCRNVKPWYCDLTIWGIQQSRKTTQKRAMSLPKASSSLVHVFKFMDWLREILLGKVSDSTVLSLWTEWQSARVTARLHQTMHTHSSVPTQSDSHIVVAYLTPRYSGGLLNSIRPPWVHAMNTE